MTVEDPVSVPPVLVETPVEANEAKNDDSSSKVAAAGATAVSTTTDGSAGSKENAATSKGKATKARKPRQRKGKAPKPGGVEEAGAFDVIELLGAERVEELQRLQEEEGRDWTKEAEQEWGKGPDGKDVEVRVVGSNDHGEPAPTFAQDPACRANLC